MWSLVWPLLRSWLLRRGLSLLGWLAAAVAVLAVLLGARRAGRNAERVEAAARYVQTTRAQLQVATNRPASRASLKRLLLGHKY